MKIKSFFIYGTGKYADVFFPKIENLIQDSLLKLIGFVDKEPKRVGKNYGIYKIFAPDILSETNFDFIFIFTNDKNFSEIYKELIEKKHIPSEKIGGYVDLLVMAEKYSRSSRQCLQNRAPLIYDCFPFFNEIDILHIRMEMLNPFVDRFVVVEMDRDHHGREKSYNFEAYKNDFIKFEDKIIYVKSKAIPLYTKEKEDWTLENYQRNEIMIGLKEAQCEDVICISDCDEIINPLIMKEIKENIYSPHRSVILKILSDFPVVMNQYFMYYYFNCCHRVKWRGSIITKFKNLTEPQVLRDIREMLPAIDNGGWHFSYFGDCEQIDIKTQSIVESKTLSKHDIMNCLKNGKDIYGRKGAEFELDFLKKDQIPIPEIDKWIEKYPKYFWNNEN